MRGDVLGRIEGAGAGKTRDAEDRRIREHDGGELVLPFGHVGEGNVLARLGLAEDETGVLLGKSPLGMVA